MPHLPAFTIALASVLSIYLLFLQPDIPAGGLYVLLQLIPFFIFLIYFS